MPCVLVIIGGVDDDFNFAKCTLHAPCGGATSNLAPRLYSIFWLHESLRLRMYTILLYIQCDLFFFFCASKKWIQKIIMDAAARTHTARSDTVKKSLVVIGVSVT